MTPHERKLWYLFLRKYPVKIYKQRIIGRFIVDFYCASARLVIELDGSQHYEPQGLAYDAGTFSIPDVSWVGDSAIFQPGYRQGFSCVCAHKLILSFEKGCKALSVTCGDSSPKGRAKGLHPIT